MPLDWCHWPLNAVQTQLVRTEGIHACPLARLHAQRKTVKVPRATNSWAPWPMSEPHSAGNSDAMRDGKLCTCVIQQNPTNALSDVGLGSIPRIDDLNACRREIRNIARDDRHGMNDPCRGDESVPITAGVRNMQSGATKCHGPIYRQDAPHKGRQHPVGHPGPQNGTLSAVPPLGLNDPHFELQKRDGRQEQR
ncbi:hypothetical protein SAMN05444339_1153 [Loktanella atrilutea]|uniref:Uncharacterized protein n=1 Tax=Loktanella atrilutea TaxID=366533 RepID=A0A1M5EUL4_LOKAT|nr:hypothetical protein SAMN05444339_1153 [Loktanella atrilutea]